MRVAPKLSPAAQLASHWRTLLRAALGLIAVYIAWVGIAYGAEATVGGQTATFGPIFDPFDAVAKTQSQTWMTTIKGLVNGTFVLLATIELCWSAAIWAFEKDNLNSLMVEFIQKIMFISFFYLLLQKGPEYLQAIIDSFADVATNGAGVDAAMSVDKIIATGFAMVKLVWRDSPFVKPPHADFSDGFGIDDLCFIIKDILDHLPFGFLKNLIFDIIANLVGGTIGDIIRMLKNGPCLMIRIALNLHIIVVAIVVSFFIIVAHAIIAFQLLCLRIESYVLLAAGMVFLGLGASRWTNQYVTKVFSYAMVVGFRLLVLLMMLALTSSLMGNIEEEYQWAVIPLLKMLGLVVLQAILAIAAPDMAKALITGEGTGFSLGAMARNAKSVAGSVTMVKKAIQAPGSAIDGAKGKYDKVKDFLKKGDKKDTASGEK